MGSLAAASTRLDLPDLGARLAMLIERTDDTTPDTVSRVDAPPPADLVDATGGPLIPGGGSAMSRSAAWPGPSIIVDRHRVYVTFAGMSADAQGQLDGVTLRLRRAGGPWRTATTTQGTDDLQVVLRPGIRYALRVRSTDEAGRVLTSPILRVQLARPSPG
jgi:hypothetical protein